MLLTETPAWEAVGAIAFVELPSATLEGYTRESGIIIVPDPNKPWEEIAAVDGTVVSVGANLNMPVFPGDKVAVNYRLTADHEKDNDGNPHYRRAFLIDGKLVWKADRLHLMAVWRTDKWQALGDWVVMKKIEEPNPNFRETTLIIPDNAKTITAKGRARFISGDLELPEGCTVFFNDTYKSPYTFPDGEEYWMINKDYILGHINA